MAILNNQSNDTKNMKIGILGGTFDPVHIGHLVMAETAADAFALDKVFMVVAHQSPFKGGEIAGPQHRLAMVKEAIKGNSRIRACDIELKRGGKSYTIDTVQYFKNKYSSAELFLVIGEDNVPGLSRWKDIEIIKEMARVIAVERDWFDVSSSLVRRRLKERKSIRYLTPDAVIRYINQHKLYTGLC